MKTCMCIRLGLALIAVQAGLWLADRGIASAQQPKPAPLSEVIGKLDSSDAAQQLKAIDEIGHRGPAAAVAAPKLIGLLSAKSAEVRWHAARALAAMGPKADKAVPSLAKALTDTDPLVRAQAAHALGQIGQASRDVVGDLGKLIADPDLRVRQGAGEALVDAGIDDRLPAGCIRLAAARPETAGLGAMFGTVSAERVPEQRRAAV